MIPVKQFDIHTDQVAHYRAIQAKFNRPRPMMRTQVNPAPKEAANDSGHETREEPVGFQSDGAEAPIQEVERDIWLAEDLKQWAEASDTPALRGYKDAMRVIRASAIKHGVSVEEILGERRNKHVVTARHEAIANVYVQFAHWSLPRIGRLFGDRDHTTILHAARRMGVAR